MKQLVYNGRAAGYNADLMTRRLAILGPFALAGLAIFYANMPAAAAQPQNDRPNVVVIYADNLGYGDLACYGHPKFKTPHLDRLAREGARLTNFYSSCPFCAPARASLMTGRYPFRSGMVRNPHPKADYGNQDATADEVGLAPSEITLGEAFQQANYRTACYGKWHLGHQPRFYPTRQGFDEYFGILYSNDMNPVELYEDEKMIEYPVDQRTLTRRYTERSLSFIQKNKDRPFFLYLAHAMPHKPLAASDRFYKQSGAGLYGDVIAELDWSIGQIMAQLARLGLDQKTLVWFTNDNGPWFGGSSGGLRGMKGQSWEGGIRVPLIARWPGVIPPGHESDEPAIIMDVFTTSLQAAGVKQPEDRTIDGRNILPLLTSDAKSPHEALLSVSGTVRSVRVGKWKLHLTGTPGGNPYGRGWVDPRAPDGKTILAQPEQYGPDDFPGVNTGDTSRSPALYDLEADPSEQHNVAAAHSELVAQLKQRVDELKKNPAPK